MKKIIQKISLLAIGLAASLFVNAQVLEVSVTIIGKTPIANNENFDASSFGDVVQGFFPLEITITNTGDKALNLSEVGGKFINLTSNGASDFIVDETGTSASIAPSATTKFKVSIAPGATNGNGKIVTLNITSNDINDPTYAGGIKYTFTNKGTTAIMKASDIGLSLYPNPCTDGHMKVKSDNVVFSKIVVSNVAGQTEEFTSTQFTTSLKGLLLVKMYTDKGIVSEKIIVQE